MAELDQAEITAALVAHMEGDAEALGRLVPLVYPELRAMARRQRRRMGSAQTLGTTGLIHEVYLKMVDHERFEWNDRGHFFAVCARMMRQILVDHARRHRAQKRGGDQARVTLDDAAASLDADAERILSVDQALERLAARDEGLVRLVECRFFAGLTEEETALTLGMSLRSAQRGWSKARLWLKKEMEAGL